MPPTPLDQSTPKPNQLEHGFQRMCVLFCLNSLSGSHAIVPTVKR